VSDDIAKEIIDELYFPVLIPIHFESINEHLIAIRYSNHQSGSRPQSEMPIGIDANTFMYENAFNQIFRIIRISTTYQMFFTGLLLAFGLIHLILFLFYPKWKPNLHFAGASICDILDYGLQF